VSIFQCKFRGSRLLQIAGTCLKVYTDFYPWRQRPWHRHDKHKSRYTKVFNYSSILSEVILLLRKFSLEEQGLDISLDFRWRGLEEKTFLPIRTRGHTGSCRCDKRIIFYCLLRGSQTGRNLVRFCTNETYLLDQVFNIGLARDYDVIYVIVSHSSHAFPIEYISERKLYLTLCFHLSKVMYEGLNKSVVWQQFFAVRFVYVSCSCVAAYY
jgi:hypothetical protein